MNTQQEDFKVFSHYLQVYQNQKPILKSEKTQESSSKSLFRRIHQNPIALGDTVISEYLPNNQNKEASSSNFTTSHHETDSIEEQKLNSEDRNEEKLKLSEFAALMTKREQEIFKPIYFNVLIVGESCLGKSTFIEAILDKVVFFVFLLFVNFLKFLSRNLMLVKELNLLQWELRNTLVFLFIFNRCKMISKKKYIKST